MSAQSTDYFTEVGDPGTATTLAAPGHTIAGTAFTVVSTSGWPTTTGVIFAIDTYDTATGVRVPGSYTEWRGVVASSTTITGAVLAYGTDQNYSAGTTTRVYIPVASSRENRLAQGMYADHRQSDGGHKVATNYDPSNLTLETQKWAGVASAVNEITVTNAATGNGPIVGATGGDTNIDLNFAVKGTGKLKGVVNNLHNPYKFSVYRNAAQTPGDGNVISFDTKNFDTGTNIDVVTNKGRFTAPIAGFYWFSANLTFATTGINQDVGLKYKKNGSAVHNGYTVVNMYAGVTNPAATASCFLQLAASDYIEVCASGGLALVVSNATLNTFSGFLVSAT